jgi:glycosyltransferase involved in cell wall biosynthesis
MAETPRITVLMPVFDAMPYLPAALESLLAQTFRGFVVLAVDDGSSDGSVEYLRSIHDARVHVLADGERRGMGAALNLGLAQTSTEFVARMDADDLSTPDRFAAQVSFLTEHPEIGSVGTQFTYIGKGGKTGFGRRLPLQHEEIYRELNAGQLAIIHASLMIRTEALRRIGGYRFAGIGEDWDMCLRLGEITRFANLSQLCYYYRLHGRNASATHQHFIQKRIGYACQCAVARRAGVPEPVEREYYSGLERDGHLAKWFRRLDSFSLAQYFTGRNMVLNGRVLTGYGHVALAAVVAPWRVTSRLPKLFRQAELSAK